MKPVLPMSAEEFHRRTGREPGQDDLDRVNCKEAGQLGHQNCGWNEKYNCPMFERMDTSKELSLAPGDIRISVSKPAFRLLQQRAGGTLTEFIERPDCILFDVGPEELAAMKELSEDMSEALVMLCVLRH